MTNLKPQRISSIWTAVVAVALLSAACGSGGDAPDVATAVSEETSTSTTATVTSATETTAEPVETTTTTEATTTTDTEVATTVEAEDCEAECPLGADELAAVQAVVDAYNAADWEAFTATQGTDEPAWDSPVGFVETMYIRWDFIWAEAMAEVWTIDECIETEERQTCIIALEDDLHRAIGLDPSACRFWFDVQESDGGELIAPIVRYDFDPCHRGYDQAMHAYGAWFERTYPDQEPIQGLHYRAWNQPDETAGDRAAEHLDEYLESGEVG